jgi:transposase
VIGVDGHAWRHTRRGDKYATVIIDLTPMHDETGPARLLDMVEGRSKQIFKGWLDAQSAEFRDGIELVAMDGFTGFKTAAAETMPDAVAGMDPFRVAAAADDALDRCRQRVQQQTCGHCGAKVIHSTAEVVPLPVELRWRPSWSLGGDHGVILTEATDSFDSDMLIEGGAQRGAGAGGR